MFVAVLVALVILCAGGERAPVVAAAVDLAAPRRVLAIYPSEPNDPIAVVLDQSLRDTLRMDDADDVVVYSEFLDIARLPEPALREAHLDWLRRKYADQPPDAV